MSNDRNESWLENFLEQLQERCFIKNGNSMEGKYQPEFIIDHVLYHDNKDLMNLGATIPDCVNEAIWLYDSWRMQEQAVGEDYLV
jgi:hypothetical protein